MGCPGHQDQHPSITVFLHSFQPTPHPIGWYRSSKPGSLGSLGFSVPVLLLSLSHLCCLLLSFGNTAELDKGSWRYWLNVIVLEFKIAQKGCISLCCIAICPELIISLSPQLRLVSAIWAFLPTQNMYNLVWGAFEQGFSSAKHLHGDLLNRGFWSASW